MHFADSRNIQIHASKPISSKRARSILAREKDWIREQMHLLQEGGWKGGTFPVVGYEVPYTVITNTRRKHPCLIIKKNERIEIETPGPMTRRACETLLNQNRDWISNIFQKNDRSGSFNTGTVRIDGEEIPITMSSTGDENGLQLPYGMTLELNSDHPPHFRGRLPKPQ